MPRGTHPDMTAIISVYYATGSPLSEYSSPTHHETWFDSSPLAVTQWSGCAPPVAQQNRVVVAFPLASTVMLCV